MLEADFADWELASEKEWAAARPGWECGGAGDGRVTLVSGRAGISLVLDAGKLGFESTRYTTGQVHLLTHSSGAAGGDRFLRHLPGKNGSGGGVGVPGTFTFPIRHPRKRDASSGK
ncbi:hypothetical protein [Streptomyces violaceorubidus]|uniref:Uncharacterized protein n=1 Tax=Streptomyces violaceorubidus TaxID=284042 RepID=A0ABV1T6D0_9ACTN